MENRLIFVFTAFPAYSCNFFLLPHSGPCVSERLPPGVFEPFSVPRGRSSVVGKQRAAAGEECAAGGLLWVKGCYILLFKKVLHN